MWGCSAVGGLVAHNGGSGTANVGPDEIQRRLLAPAPGANVTDADEEWTRFRSLYYATRFPAVIVKFLALRNYTLLHNGLRGV